MCLAFHKNCGALFAVAWAVSLSALCVEEQAAVLAVSTQPKRVLRIAADPNNLGQLSSLFSLIWVVGTCVALLRREPRRAAVPAVA